MQYLEEKKLTFEIISVSSLAQSVGQCLDCLVLKSARRNFQLWRCVLMMWTTTTRWCSVACWSCVNWTCEASQCRYGYPMYIIHPCGLWMYRGMREMIVECWCVNLRKVWSHAVLVCIVHVVCTTVQYRIQRYIANFYFRVFMLPSQMIHEDGGSRSKGSPAGNSLKKIKLFYRYMDLCLLSLWVDQFSVTFMTLLNSVFQD